MDSVTATQTQNYSTFNAIMSIQSMLPMIINFILQLEIFKLIIDMIRSVLR